MATAVQEDILNKEVDRAKDRRDAAEANATPDERIALNAAHRERAKELRQKEVSMPHIHIHSPPPSLAHGAVAERCTLQ